MSIAAVVDQGRRLAESLMIDTGTITRPTGGQTWDDETQQSVPAAPATVYTGKCRVRVRPVGDRVVESGGQSVTLASYLLTIPVDATDVQVGDEFTASVSNDPLVVGRRLILKSVDAATASTARRFICSHDQG